LDLEYDENRGAPTVFVGFPPCLHRIRGIPTVFTSHSWDSRRVYIAFVGFPPCLHRIRGIPTVFISYSWVPTLFTSYSWDSHRIYIVFVEFPPYLHRFRGIPTVFTSYSQGFGISRGRRFPLDKCVYTWYSSLYFSVICLMIAEGCLLIFYGQSLYVGELHYD
jgi:hypothetical protein